VVGLGWAIGPVAAPALAAISGFDWREARTGALVSAVAALTRRFALGLLREHRNLSARRLEAKGTFRVGKARNPMTTEKTPAEVFAREARGDAPGRDRLRGRRIVVVGAGRETYGLDDPPLGNGQAISCLCAREGAAVACIDRTIERAEETAQRVREVEGGTAFALAGDASVEADVVRLAESARKELGGVDGLVCNVGIGRGRGVEGTSAEDFDLVFAVNVRSHFLFCRELLPHMGQGAAIVLISSLAGHRPGSGLVAYDASKAALSGLLRQTAREAMKRGVRANNVVPGLIDTSLGRIATLRRPNRTARLPFGRQGTAWEVAYAVIFLLSEESSYVSGHELIVDGGISLL
jgi:NAD(P)-dependent dehydrogenase (short-subunit alcohol dehydrogenase family)